MFNVCVICCDWRDCQRIAIMWGLRDLRYQVSRVTNQNWRNNEYRDRFYRKPHVRQSQLHMLNNILFGLIANKVSCLMNKYNWRKYNGDVNLDIEWIYLGDSVERANSRIVLLEYALSVHLLLSSHSNVCGE